MNERVRFLKVSQLEFSLFFFFFKEKDLFKIWFIENLKNEKKQRGY